MTLPEKSEPGAGQSPAGSPPWRSSPRATPARPACTVPATATSTCSRAPAASRASRRASSRAWSSWSSSPSAGSCTPALIGVAGHGGRVHRRPAHPAPPLTQALAGIVGVGLSAWLANTTGKAEDFYVLGFFTNIAYILAMTLSVVFRWPFAGLIFGFIRNEGLEWRKHPARVKAYQIGTWVIISVLVLRLVVQVPLYFMGEQGLAALATTRLLMGAPALHPRRLGGLAAHPPGAGPGGGPGRTQLSSQQVSF